MACGWRSTAPDPQDGFRSVVAQVRGITWPACAATMEVALRRRLAGVAEVAISQSHQTAAITFHSATRQFSAEVFRQAVAEADVEVLSLEADVCGVVDGQGELFSVADPNRPLVRLRGGQAYAGRTVCVRGRLDDRVEPNEIDVVTVRAVS